MSSTEQPVKKLQIFRSHNAHIQYIFHGMSVNAQGVRVPNGIGGKAAVFMAGEYRTDVAEEIAELDEEIRLKHPFIHRDPARMEMDAEDVDPLVALKKQHFKEFAAAQKLAMNPNKNMGNSSGPGGEGTGVATSAGASGNAAASNSPAGTPAAGFKVDMSSFKKAP